MLTYFPRPYDDELLYSIIARCQLHMGITSPKTFLDELYGDRKVAAVVDMPSHLSILAQSIKPFWQVSPLELIYKRTLFPLYSIFIPEKRKQEVVAAMIGADGGGIHTRVGMAASRVAIPLYFRYCPLCITEMVDTYGEPYWSRLQQVVGVSACPKHSCTLQDTCILFRSGLRHEYFAARPNSFDVLPTRIEQSEHKIAMTKAIQKLLTLSDISSPTYWQWSHFYHQMATDNGLKLGQKIKLSELIDAFLSTWSEDYLKGFNLSGIKKDNSWLLCLFRKHRKSFSYLQHLLVWTAFRPAVTIQNLIEECRSYPVRRIVAPTLCSPARLKELDDKRAEWLRLLKTHRHEGVKNCRLIYGGGALYAWLYRYDRNWLLKVDEKYSNRNRVSNSCVNWSMRDWSIVKKLLHIQWQLGEKLDSPRHSRNWFLLQLPHRQSIEHHLTDLPLCCAFFERYCESIEEYQIRRITKVVCECIEAGEPVKRWEVERAAGLVRERLSRSVNLFLQNLEKQYGLKINCMGEFL